MEDGKASMLSRIIFAANLQASSVVQDLGCGGAGILPVCFHQDQLFVLLQHEIRSHYKPRSEKCYTFIDFGGGSEKSETTCFTAAREFLEELHYGVEDLLLPYKIGKNDLVMLAKELQNCSYAVKGKGRYVCFPLPVSYVPSFVFAHRLINLNYKGKNRKIQTFWWFPASMFSDRHLPIHSRLKISGLAEMILKLREKCIALPSKYYDVKPLFPEKSDIKSVIRRMVWESMDSCGEVNFPRPCFERIPNFVRCEKAAQILCQTDAFNNAKLVKVNPSLAQEECRYLTLKHGKILLTPSPALETVFMYKISPDSWNEKTMRFAATKQGAVKLGSKLSVSSWPDPSIQIDLLIVASVAVCPRTGTRLGKGKGYGELEWAILCELGAIHDGTVIATTVSESQIVYDMLPDEVSHIHDLKVDLIATPERLIKIPRDESVSRRQQVLWSLLTEEQIREIPALSELRSLREKDDAPVKSHDEENE